jgi:hypothetical protein
MNNRVIMLGSTLLGTAVGAVAGYLVAKHRLEAKYAQFASDEIEAARDYMKVLYKKDEDSTPEKALARRRPQRPEGVDDTVHEGPPTEVLEKVLDKLRYGKVGVPVSEPKARNDVNVFDGDTTDEDDVDETSLDGFIEIISYTEYNAGEKEYEQVTLTYFAEDDTLCDEDDMPIEDVNAVVGNSSLEKFGYRSRDPRIVYVRNNRLRIDYTVCKSDGSYAEEVAGFKPPKERKVDRFRE